MEEYSLRHPKCGAVWEAEYDVIPEMITCIQCGLTVKKVYEPVIYMVTPKHRKERRDRNDGIFRDDDTRVSKDRR